MPFVLHTMFWVGFWMPVGAVLVVCLKLFAGDYGSFHLYDQEVTAADLFISGGAIPLAVAAIGVALAYGIWSKREYPRYLSILVLAAGALWANIRMFRTLEISWAPIAAAIAASASIKYLLTNPDVKEYYRRGVAGDAASAEIAE